MALPKLPSLPTPGEEEKDEEAKAPKSLPKPSKLPSPKISQPKAALPPVALPSPGGNAFIAPEEDEEDFENENEDDSSILDDFLSQMDEDEIDEEETDDDFFSSNDDDEDNAVLLNDDDDDEDDFQSFIDALEQEPTDDDDDDEEDDDSEWGIVPISDDDDEEDGFSAINDETVETDEEDDEDDEDEEEEDDEIDSLEAFLKENEEEEEDGDEDEPTSKTKEKPKKEKPEKEGNGPFSKLKDYWNGFAEKAKQESPDKKEDKPSSDEKNNVDPDEPKNTEEPEQDENESEGFLKSISAGYSKLHQAFFKALLKVLNFLAKIPVIGKFFRKILQATRIIEKVSHFLPIIIIFLIWLLINIFYVSTSYTLELPDEGQVEVSNAQYDSSTNTLNAEIENTGEVIVDVSTDYTVYSTQLGLNPITWFIPQETTTCSADWVVIEQADIETVEAQCEETDTGGFWFRTTPERVTG